MKSIRVTFAVFTFCLSFHLGWWSCKSFEISYHLTLLPLIASGVLGIMCLISLILDVFWPDS